MLPAPDRRAVQDMLEHAREGLVACAGRSRAELDTDRSFQLVARSLITVVGEAARRVTPATRERHPQIPWREIVGARDRVVHGYDQLDYDVIWQILTRDLTALVAALALILEQDA